jgi:hypothetical protein
MHTIALSGYTAMRSYMQTFRPSPLHFCLHICALAGVSGDGIDGGGGGAGGLSGAPLLVDLHEDSAALQNAGYGRFNAAKRLSLLAARCSISCQCASCRPAAWLCAQSLQA